MDDKCGRVIRGGWRTTQSEGLAVEVERREDRAIMNIDKGGEGG